MKDITIMVTGATGRTGVELCHQLAAIPGVAVRAATHSPHKRALLPSSVETVAFDVADAAGVAAAFRGADALFAVMPGGPPGPLGSAVMAGAARAAGIQRIVKLSSYDPENDHPTPTDRWAVESEARLADSGIPCTFLRPPWFYQNFHNGYFTPMLLRGALPLPFGEGRSGWIDCRDVAAVAVKALLEDGHAGEAYTLTGPRAISLAEIAAVLSRVTAQEIRYVPLSDEQWVALGRSAGLSDDEVFGILALMAKTRDGHAARLTTEVERILGRAPLSFEQYAVDHAAALTALATQASAGG
jgi:uncharacterized protein YbjT (DUF2867 family)